MLVILTYRRGLPRLVLKRIITIIKFDADVDNFDDDVDEDDDIMVMTVVGQVSIRDGYHKMRMRRNLSGLRLTLVSPIPRSSTSISAAIKASRYKNSFKCLRFNHGSDFFDTVRSICFFPGDKQAKSLPRALG